MENPRNPALEPKAAGGPSLPTSPTGIGRPEAALASWNWKEGQVHSPAGRGRETRRARQDSLVRAVIGGGIGGLFWFFGHGVLAAVVWGISGFVLAAGWLSPHGVYRAIEGALGTFARWVGLAMSWFLLPMFFFGFFLVFGLLARRGRKDRMERWFEPGPTTYWKERRDPPREESFYRRQF